MIQILKNTNINFVGFRFVAYVISAFLVGSGLIATVQIARGHANLGIDFSGGSLVSLKFETEQDPSKIRDILDKNGLSDTNIQQVADAPGEPKKKVLLRIKKSNVKVGAIGEFIDKIFNEQYPSVDRKSVV
jgi:preprotein translocase subunit SecF